MSLAMARIGGLAVVFVAVLGGVALVTGAGVIMDSGFRSQPAVRLAGADVVVSAPQSIRRAEDLPLALPERATVPTTLTHQIAAIPGVAATTGDLSFPAAKIPTAADTVAAPDASADGDSTAAANTSRDAASPTAPEPAGAGHGWASLAFSGGRVVEGRAPRADGEVALRDGQIGRRVQIMAGGVPGTYRVTALVDAPGIYFSDATAAALAGRTSGPRAGTVDLVAVRADTGVDPEELAARIKDRIGAKYQVTTGRDRADAESPGAAAGRTLLLVLPGSIGGISLLIVGFVVGGGMSLSIDRQRRDLALLRGAGATPRQVRRVVGLQGTIAAGLALVPGAALGYYLAARFGDLLVTIGALRADQPLVYGPLPALAAALPLFGVVRVASWAASLRISQLPVVSGIAGLRRPSRARTNAGLLLIAGSLVLSAAPLLVRTEVAAVGPSMAAILAVIGLALAGPRLVQRVAGAVAASPLVSRLRGPAWLAVHNTHGHALRTAGAIAALGMVVTLGLSVVFTQSTLDRARSDETAQAMSGLVTITAPGLGGIPRDLLADVRTRTRAAGMTMTTVATEPLQLGDDPTLMARPVMALGPDAEGLVDLGLAAGRLRDLRGPAVALDERVGR
ncbi:hypothetical protein C1I98_06215, partial [Spongiactinospora gelatinilytica]